MALLIGLMALGSSSGTIAWADDDHDYDEHGDPNGDHEYGEEDYHHEFTDVEDVWWGHKGVAFATYMPFEKTDPPKPIDLRPFDAIYFDLDKADLRPAAIATCDEVLAYLKDHPETKIRVEGHCCDWGTTNYNKKLGMKRARAIKKYLTKHGIKGKRIRTVSRGENHPAHENTGPERPLNRRAEVAIRLTK
jgi:outer membrane protein OmpA-like peptidoglycan-associated protein